VFDFGPVLAFYALLMAGAYLLVPILLVLVMLVLGVAGFIVSMFSKDQR
jgi:hypothetical protein